MTNTYRSKRDWWLVGLIRLSIVVLVGGLAVTWFSPGPFFVKVFTCTFIFVAAGFSWHVLEGTAYDVSDERLTARSGLLRWNVPIDAIIRVKPSRSVRSGPALSLDRLHVVYQGSWGGVMISPDDRDAFLADLANRSPRLKVVDGAIVRVDHVT